jgi:hypothetical protein
MRKYTTSKQVMAGILFLSHVLASCSSPNINKQNLQDTTTKLTIHPSNANLNPSSNKEEIESQLPTLSQESNDATINFQLENPSVPSETELKTELQDPDLTGTDANVVVSEGKKEVRPPLVLESKQAASTKRTPWAQTSMINSVDRNEEEGESKPSNKADNQETDHARMDLAIAILSTTRAEPDTRLNIYYHLASQLGNHLKEDAALRGEWNALWQKLQEPELLVSKEAYYKKAYQEAFKRLETAMEEIQLFKAKLATYGPDSLGWQKDLEYLATFYKQFKEKLIQASLDTKDPFKLYNLLEPKALLMGEWWPDEYYRIDQTMARHLIGKDEFGHRIVEEEKESTSNHHNFFTNRQPLRSNSVF